MRLFVPAIIALTVFACPFLASAELSLSEAVQQGLVTAEFEGRGASSGDSIAVTVRRTRTAGSKKLELGVQPGTILRSTDDITESMAIASVRGRDVKGMIVLDPTITVPKRGGHATYILEAYGADFEKATPTKATSFSLHPVNPTLACIFENGRIRDAGMDVLQAAVWMHTDGVTFDELQPRYPVKEADWQVAYTVAHSCGIKAEEVPAEVLQRSTGAAHPLVDLVLDEEAGPRMVLSVADPKGLLDDDTAHMVTVDNQSGEPVLIKLMGPVEWTLSLDAAAEMLVQLPNGMYDVKLRYGELGSYHRERARVRVTDQTKLIPLRSPK